ncbi:MAG: type II toxin-antitoxin system VapC family toxin [Nanoarchaeota archaeon]
MIVDTSFVIDLMDGVPEAVEKAKQLWKEKENLFVTTLTVYELWSVITQRQNPEHEKRKVLEVLDSQLIMELDEESAKEGGRIDGVLVREGLRIDPEDCMIAGIAKHHQETVLTRNVKHFERIKGLSVESY